MKTYLYCQSDEHYREMTAAKQESIMRDNAEAIAIHETSNFTTAFKNRTQGGWLLRNATEGDTVVVVSLRHLGCNMPDVRRTLEQMRQNKAKVLITSFGQHGQLTLDGKLFTLFVNLLDVLVPGVKGIRKAQRNNSIPRVRRITRSSYWGCRLEPYTTKLGVEMTRRVWDGTQLGYCAEIARRLLLDREPAEYIVNDFHARGIKDHTGRLFGTQKRKARKFISSSKEFIDAATFFMRAGKEAILPPQWTDAALVIARELKKALKADTSC